MKVLLYYLYTKIENKEIYHNSHTNFCQNYDFKGRIIIANEGLNGTISGSKEDCNKYMDFVKSDSRFKDIDFKINDCDEHLFEKLTIKIKPYLI